MTVSVALACCNGSKFIINQLESLRNQSLLPDEVVICDDASEDNTVELIRNYIDKYGLADIWRLNESKENQGYIRNFRKAISECSGDVVFLCDQDDIWQCDKIQKMTDVMKEHPNVLSLACNYDIINQFGYKTEIDFIPMYSAASHMKCGAVKRIRGRILQGNIAQGCACVYRKSLVEEYLSKDAGYKLPHDWALNLLAFERNGLYYLNLPLISYRVHEDNTSGAISCESSECDRVSILRKLAENTERAADFVSERKCVYLTYASFVRHRADVAEKGRFASFKKGFMKYPQFAFGNSFLQYCKDLYSSKKN